MKISPPVLPVSLAVHLQILKKISFICNMSTSLTIIHVTWVVLDGQDRFGVYIMKMTREVGFMKSSVSLIFFAIDNCSISLLSKYIITNHTVQSTIYLTENTASHSWVVERIM